MRCEEAQELITALVDNELSRPERSFIESHLKDCPKCRLIYGQEQALKREVRMAGAGVSAPAELREKILFDRRTLPEKAESAKGREWLVWAVRPSLRPAFVLALLILLAFPTLYLMRPMDQPIPLSALKTHQEILAGTISFTRAENQEGIKEQLLRAAEARFSPMGYDLSMMNLLAVGGLEQEAGGRKLLVTIYEGQGLFLTCYTFLGTEEDAPDEAERFFDPDKKINFYTFSRNGVNGVLHREGKVICILVSRMPLPELLALARSKAQPS